MTSQKVRTYHSNIIYLLIIAEVYRRRFPKDPTDTIRHIVEKMLRELGAIPEPIPWGALFDSI